MPVLAVNKRASYDYNLGDSFEAGMVLFGHEVKAIKTKRASLKGAFVTIKQDRTGTALFLTNAHISKYDKASTVKDYDPDRPRKLLVHKNELNRLIGKKQEQGLTLVPTKIYTRHGLLKLEFVLGRGKKKYDKREAIKKRELDRNIRSLTKMR